MELLGQVAHRVALDEADRVVDVLAAAQRTVDHDEIGGIHRPGDRDLHVGHALVHGQHQASDVVRGRHPRRVGRLVGDDVSGRRRGAEHPAGDGDVDDLRAPVAPHRARGVRRADPRAVAVDPHAGVDSAHTVDEQDRVGSRGRRVEGTPLARRQLDVDRDGAGRLGLELGGRAVFDVPRIDGELHVSTRWIVDVRAPFTTS